MLNLVEKIKMLKSLNLYHMLSDCLLQYSNQVSQNFSIHIKNDNVLCNSNNWHTTAQHMSSCLHQYFSILSCTNIHFSSLYLIRMGQEWKAANNVIKLYTCRPS